ncbi:hypothetical protein [Streptomyces griseoluteus]
MYDHRLSPSVAASIVEKQGNYLKENDY